MMYLITGMPGNGKTLYAVDFIRKARAKGREVYSDIKGLLVPGVHPAPDDWRTLPDGVLVVYDEAHKRFPAFKGKGRSPLEVVRDMDEHRHRGIDLMFITQWPDKIDGEMFRLIGTHWHLNRAFGLQKASVTQFTRAVMNPYSYLSRKGSDETVWDYPKDVYALYTSSSQHTDAHKFKLPAKARNVLISAPIVLAVLWGITAYMKHRVGGAAGGAERSSAEPKRREAAATQSSFDLAVATPVSERGPLSPGAGGYAPINTEAAPALAGCVSSDRGCRCFNTEGFQIDMSRFQCELLLEKPLPFNVYHDYKAPVSSPSVGAVGRSAGQGGGVVVGYQPEQRGDVMPRNPARSVETYTPPTTTL